MKQPLKGIAYIIVILMVASSIYYTVGLGVAISTQPTAKSRCLYAKVDTIYNMVTEKKWEVNDNLPLIVDHGCVVNQDVVIMQYWSPVVNHSQIIN